MKILILTDSQYEQIEDDLNEISGFRWNSDYCHADACASKGLAILETEAQEITSEVAQRIQARLDKDAPVPEEAPPQESTPFKTLLRARMTPDPTPQECDPFHNDDPCSAE